MASDTHVCNRTTWGEPRPRQHRRLAHVPVGQNQGLLPEPELQGSPERHSCYSASDSGQQSPGTQKTIHVSILEMVALLKAPSLPLVYLCILQLRLKTSCILRKFNAFLLRFFQERGDVIQFILQGGAKLHSICQ